MWSYAYQYSKSYYGGAFIRQYEGYWQQGDTVAVPIEACRCAIYRPLVFDTITKADYLEAAGIPSREVGGGFVELRTEFDPSPYIPVRPDLYWEFGDDPGFVDWASGDDRSRSYCQWMFDYRQGLPSTDPLHLPSDAFIRQERGSEYFYPASVEKSDVIYRLYSTRRVDLSFLRGRISHRMTSLIDEGLADSLIAEEYNTFRADDTVNPMLNRIGIADEVSHRRYRSFQHVNSVVQRTMRDSGDTRGVWFNPPENPDLNRISTGDFDSLRTREGDTNMKALHMTARQAYKLGMDHPVPVTVRRPVVVLKNSTSTMADSFMVEKISRNGVWIDTVAVGAELELDWIRPGRGEMYRVTPIRSPASYAATAYNNSVHAENTSNDNTEGDRLVVIERDSAIWLRRFHSTTGWSDEVLISSGGDTTHDPQAGHRIAHATTPAIATARDDSATLIVWQRTDAQILFGTIEGLHVPGPPTSANLANATPLTFSAPRALNSPWMTMNPAVVGLDSGWVVAWGSPSDGIEVVSVRNNSSPSPPTDISNAITVKAGTAVFDPALPPVPLDQVCKFPTLAYVSNLDTNGRHVHMAWQQGQDSLLGGVIAGAVPGTLP